jgi:hypothetical protein
METRLNGTFPAEYASLAKRCGEEPHSPKTVVRALRDCLFMVGLYDDGKLVAFARVTGDGAMLFVITDLMVDPDWEDSGAAMLVYKEVDDFLLASAPNDSRVLAFVDTKYLDVFRRFGYKFVDTDFRDVMIRE